MVEIFKAWSNYWTKYFNIHLHEIEDLEFIQLGRSNECFKWNQFEKLKIIWFSTLQSLNIFYYVQSLKTLNLQTLFRQHGIFHYLAMQYLFIYLRGT